MTKTLCLFVLLGSAAAHADLGDAHAISIGDDFELGGDFSPGTWYSPASGGIVFAPSADWFPMWGLSVGGVAGISYTFPEHWWGLGVGLRAGYAFHLPDRWTIWPRVGVTFGTAVGVPEVAPSQELTADCYIGRAIGDHLYVGIRPQAFKFVGAQNVLFTATGVIGATF